MSKEYIGQQKHGIEKGFKNTQWIEQELAVKADNPLIDSGRGKKVIIRKFDFEWQKGMTKEKKMEAQTMNRQEFFNAHAKYIRDFLWRDGLSIMENEDPKIMFNKKGYVIALACEARFGVSIFERGNTLQDIIKPPIRK